jgi:hypothetical protein
MSAEPLVHGDNSPDNASIEATVQLCRDACFDGEPDGSGDYGTVCSNRKVIELCESVLALRAAHAETARELATALSLKSAAVSAMRDFTVCFPCGWRWPNAEAEAHGSTCEKHPQRRVEAERDALRVTLEQYRERCQVECIDGGRTGAPELQRQAAALAAEVAELREALGRLYDRIADGDPCFEDPENSDGYSDQSLQSKQTEAIARALAEAVAQEREACARVCEERRATCCEENKGYEHPDEPCERCCECIDCAAAIRARAEGGAK